MNEIVSIIILLIVCYVVNYILKGDIVNFFILFIPSVLALIGIMLIRKMNRERL